jgi:hypothetical protein
MMSVARLGLFGDNINDRLGAPGRSTRWISARARSTSGTVHSLQVLSAWSTLAVSSGSEAVQARTENDFEDPPGEAGGGAGPDLAECA